jgi:L-lactate dehydrogenase complex protein LldG
VSARERILARVRAAQEERGRAPHPGPFQASRPVPLPADPVEAFSTLFLRAGGEVARVPDDDAAVPWIRAFAAGFGSVAVGATVPDSLAPAPAGAAEAACGPTVYAAPESAELGVSMALGAVGETGSLLLSSRDGRRTQLLPPTHLVLVRADSVHATLAGALESLRPSLPATVGLHSGPSKSADIGQILVRGVHGPGRVVALLIGP